LHWPVPATDDDVKRIEQLMVTTADEPRSAAVFRRLPPGHAAFRGFTHTLEKRKDGRCTFLSEDNRCSLHLEHGAEAKPGMCRLFPYSFTPTPNGTYVYVSFASTGVLANTGRLLSEQKEQLASQLQLFHQLFPQVNDDWSSLQSIDGTPLTWERYLQLDSQFLELLHPDSQTSLTDALLECSRLVQAEIPSGVECERLPPLGTPDTVIDQIVLKQLSDLYWPRDVFSDHSFDFSAREFMAKLVQPITPVTICGGKQIEQLATASLGELPPEQEQLLRRFIYARVFAKLYFGRSYAHLSLLAGIHHLIMLTVLLRLYTRAAEVETGEVTFWDFAEIVRTLERRLTQMNFSKESCVVLEILLSSPARATRMVNMAAQR
jgi:Fe-S-cluster containining protein